jgi:hypothetical protein
MGLLLRLWLDFDRGKCGRCSDEALRGNGEASSGTLRGIKCIEAGWKAGGDATAPEGRNESVCLDDIVGEWS